MSAPEVIAVLLGVISILLTAIAYFLARLLTKMDGLFNDVHKMRQAFVLFRQRVCLQFGWPVDDDDSDSFTPQTTSPT